MRLRKAVTRPAQIGLQARWMDGPSKRENECAIDHDHDKAFDQAVWNELIKTATEKGCRR